MPFAVEPDSHGATPGSPMPAPRFFVTAGAFREWLKANAATAPELLVGFYKVDSGRPSLSWSESVDEALCFGWIDGVRRRVDGASYSIRFTPRKPTSIWSAVNIAKVAQLQARGRMTAAGVAAFSRRQEHRSAVYAYEQESVPELSAPEVQEFQRAAAAGWEFFQTCPPGYRKVVVHWVTSAKRVETRASRLATLVRACAAGQRLR